MNSKNEYKINRVDQVEKLLSLIDNNNTIDEIDKVNEKNKVLDALFSDTNKKNGIYNINGSSDDFHNLSISALTIDGDYQLAFQVAVAGLQLHQFNTDLLADAIRYGNKCQDIDTCYTYFNTLKKIEYQKWTWRAFSFSIDFLLETLSNLDSISFNSTVSEIEKISENYLKYYITDDSYFCKSKVFASQGNRDAEQKILQEALEKVTYCTKCWLKLADLYIDNGDFKHAKIYVSYLRKTPNSKSDVNLAYVYYLDGLCKLKEMLDKDDYPEIEVRNAYNSFKRALFHHSANQNLKQSIIDDIEQLQFESFYQCPFDYKHISTAD
ncbi:MAG: hypothetical protein IJX77_07050 [Ruminococcus sp.]|nr:hypothetical protein [Ruminococcus sp.]